MNDVLRNSKEGTDLEYLNDKTYLEQGEDIFVKCSCDQLVFYRSDSMLLLWTENQKRMATH